MNGFNRILTVASISYKNHNEAYTREKRVLKRLARRARRRLPIEIDTEPVEWRLDNLGSYHNLHKHIKAIQIPMDREDSYEASNERLNDEYYQWKLEEEDRLQEELDDYFNDDYNDPYEAYFCCPCPICNPKDWEPY